MFASVLSASIFGMEICPVQVEADVSDGLPSFIMVGFPSAQVKEAQDRVRTALKNNGISMPPKRVTVNLAPADIKKEGAGFDLPVAAAVMAAAGILHPKALEGVMIMGELSLNGEIHGISGVLPRIIRARELKCRYCLIPEENIEEAGLVEDIRVIGVKNLEEMLQCLREPERFEGKTIKNNRNYFAEERYPVDFSEICGQESARRAAEIAASGFHNILFIGPPGAGKTMISRRIPTIMPRLTFEEVLELTKIYSIAGLLDREHPLIGTRPFRSPHHTSSPQALAGGGRIPSPGEVTLAERGVLFLDEMPEFSRKSLEILRQPLEDKKIQLSRTSGTFVFPAHFMLVAAMNPCPCGMVGSDECICTPGEIAHYLGKISQPLLDRIDLCADVPAVSFSEMNERKKGESSAVIRARVERAREFQKSRWTGEGFKPNGELTGKEVETYCVLTEEARRLLGQAFDALGLSARAYHRLLKVARTIADLEAEEKINTCHIAEALTCRAFDKKYRA